MNTWAEIILNMQKCRDETAARYCEDMVLTDGTVMWTKEQGIESVKQYDNLLDSLNRLAGDSEVAQECP